jgi:4-hydroxybenzoate polyprenyltransferase
MEKINVVQKLIAFNNLVELNTVNRWLAATAMGVLYFEEMFNVRIEPLNFIIGLFASFLILCYVMAINDCFDVEEDKIKSKLTPKKIIVGNMISFNDALFLSIIMLMLGLILSWFVSRVFFIFLGLIVILSTLYSVPPIRYKKIFPISTLGESVGAFLPFLSGYAILNQIDIKAIIVSAFFAIITIYLRFFHEATFYDVDKKSGKKTFAVIYGPKFAHNIGRFFLILGIAEICILLYLGAISLKFFSLAVLYLLFSLSLLITFLKLYLPKKIYSIFLSLTNQFPQIVRSIFKEHVLPIWGLFFIVIIVIFQLL